MHVGVTHDGYWGPLCQHPEGCKNRARYSAVVGLPPDLCGIHDLFRDGGPGERENP